MKKKTIILIVIIAVIVLIASSLISTYNGLNNLRSEVEGSKAQISTQLQRRSDLIPNLVETVKGYAAHESEVFTALADARSKLNSASTTAEQAAANDELSSAISRLLVIVEQYPTLKADSSFIALQDQLEGTENRIATARTDYNEDVKAFNNKIRSFPTNILSGILGFSEFEYFQASENANQVPSVNF